MTGAGSGIGLALTRALFSRGMNVVLADRDARRVADAAAAFGASDRVLPVLTDVADFESVAALADRVAAEFGPVHLLANNAGIMRPDTAVEQSLEDWHEVFGVNVFGVIHGYKAVVPLTLRHGEPAHVLNTASVGGLTAGTYVAAYMVSKHAVVALSESLAADTAGSNIGVTVLCPGGTHTDAYGAEWRRRQARGISTTYPEGVQERFARIADAASPDVLEPILVASVAIDAVERAELYAFVFPQKARELLRGRLASIEAAVAGAEALGRRIGR